MKKSLRGLRLRVLALALAIATAAITGTLAIAQPGGDGPAAPAATGEPPAPSAPKKSKPPKLEVDAISGGAIGAEPVVVGGGAPPPAMTREQRAAYSKQLREKVAAARERVMSHIDDRFTARQGDKLKTLTQVLFIISCFSGLLLLSPIVLIDRYPKRFMRLFGYSVLSALTFFVALNMFNGVLLLLRYVQAEVSVMTNPQIVLVEATFDSLEDNADLLVEVGPTLIEPALAEFTADSDDPLPVVLLDNVGQLRDDVKVFGLVGSFLGGVASVFGFLPIVVMVLTALIFLLAARPTLQEILRLPMRGAEGEKGVARRVIVHAFRRIWREAGVIAILIVILIVVTLLGGVLLVITVTPAMDTFVSYLTINTLYLQMERDVSSLLVLVSLGSVVFFLAFNIVLTLVATVGFVAKAQKLLQQRFHMKIPIRAHKRYWRWGTASMLWVLAFPLAFMFGAQLGIAYAIEAGLNAKEINWPLLLGSGPLILIVGFAFLFWLLRGLKGLMFVLRYNVQ